MKTKCIIFMILVVCCGSVFAETEIVTLQVKGYGSSRNEAINNALAQAVAQTRGVGVSSGDYEFGFRSAAVDVDRDEDTKKKIVEFDAVSVHTKGSMLKTYIDGYIKTYEVIEEKELDDGRFFVKLKAYVYDYESSEETARSKIAVMPLKMLQRNYPFGDLIISSSYITHELSQKLNVRLSETSKFDVLDREYVTDFAQNRNINLSADSSLEAKAQLGEVLACDYMIVGTVSDARLEVSQRSTSAIGRAVRRFEADFAFEYRVIVCATRQVKLAETVRLNLETAEIRKLVKKWRPDNIDYREVMDGILNLAANSVAETIIDRIYPARIARIDPNGQIIINQGGRRISKGRYFEVFSPGGEIIDADTNMSLGSTESAIATIMIQQVSPTLSYARVVQGDIGQLSNGLVCRMKGIAIEDEGRVKSDIQRTSSGGIVLPFD